MGHAGWSNWQDARLWTAKRRFESFPGSTNRGPAPVRGFGLVESFAVRAECEHTFAMAVDLDWAAIRDYYEVGHTVAECQEFFGFSNGSWHRAVGRGDIVPRPNWSGRRAGDKRALVWELRAQGKTYVQIAKELGLAKS